MAETDIHDVPSTSSKASDLDAIAESIEDVERPSDITSQEGTPVDSHSANGDTRPVDETPEGSVENSTKTEEGKAPGKAKFTIAKPSMSVKAGTATTKPRGPTTPIVKKVLNSGTFGSGSVKPPSTRPAPHTADSAAKHPAPPRRSINSASTKPPMASRPTAASSTSATAARRTSVVPTKTPLSHPSKPTTGVTAASATASHTSASPTASKATSPVRPRASVSDAVKRAPLTARQSLPSTTKLSHSASAKAPAAKPGLAASKARATSSISSIREVRDDSKLLEELQTKVKEATDALTSKTEEATDLKAQLSQAHASLEAVKVELESKASAAIQSEESRASLETRLESAQAAYDELKNLQAEGDITLEAVRKELEDARAATLAQTEFVASLQEQIKELEAEVAKTKDNIKALKDATTAATSEAALAASVEHDALLEAQEDLAAIQAELGELKKSHALALAEAMGKNGELEVQVAKVDALEALCTSLQQEKEESANRVSELEIEVLELNESQESFDEERELSLNKLKALQDELAAATAAAEKANSYVQAKEAEYISTAETVKVEHENALKAAAEEQSKVLAQLDSLKNELATALSTHETLKNEALKTAETHSRALDEAEQRYIARQSELSEEIDKITAELEGQEAQYNAKVDTVKEEHSKLLEEAFERAKTEAGDDHKKDLNAVRTNFDSTIAQMAATHHSAMEDLKAEHASTLEAQAKMLEKQITNLTLDLKATQDDLAKAKASFESARAEIDTLTAQRDEARAAAAAVPEVSPEQAEEIARLTTQLSVTKDDLSAITDMLNLTKDSLTEMSHNHTKELEEVAKARAEEVTKLRTAHEEELSVLGTQKSELLVKLSDLEGELATAKAALAAEPAVPKSNGTVPPQSPGVTKEELQRLHEAHNLKVHDLEAEHQKALKALSAKLEATEAEAKESKLEVERKEMEIKYLESDQEDASELITRLKEDLETMSEQLKAKSTGSD
ncbi:uncharacterized protein EV420DRAFT_1301516 [Desarmillaria tabescens]|uniref:Uncharacterized protein n=1 Tax=Armillaria tabescens TaxID=1929756 RepID=A0AA39NG33_ARMTA|nr:uncharacterized protein EV420DRAFT_1301516 [Desarmillaria tabescens]KAK0464960.1 hypothetical protein EV420DRAFT_1301516 [Desarmillaria tabescens]